MTDISCLSGEKADVASHCHRAAKPLRTRSDFAALKAQLAHSFQRHIYVSTTGLQTLGAAAEKVQGCPGKVGSCTTLVKQCNHQSSHLWQITR